MEYRLIYGTDGDRGKVYYGMECKGFRAFGFGYDDLLKEALKNEFGIKAKKDELALDIIAENGLRLVDKFEVNIRGQQVYWAKVYKPEA